MTESTQFKVRSSGPIVLVDDSDDDIFIARRCYQRSRLTNAWVSFKMGADFLAHLDEVAEEKAEMPALVLLDINMPAMNGFEVLAAVRQKAPLVELPVIMMLTNSDYEKDRETAMALGALGYQVKPVDIAEYVEFFDALFDEAANH